MGGSGGPDTPFPGPPFSSVTPPPIQPDLTDKCNVNCKLFLNCLICSLGQLFTDIKGSKYMLVHSLASKYAIFVVLVRPPVLVDPPSDHWTPPFKI